MHTFKEEGKKKKIYIYIRRARTGSVRAQRSERSALATGRSQLPVAGGRGSGMKPREGRRVPPPPSAVLGSLRAFHLWFQDYFSSTFHSLDCYFLFCFIAIPSRSPCLPAAMPKTQREAGCR